MFGFAKRDLTTSRHSTEHRDEGIDDASSEEAGSIDERKEKRFVRKLDFILVTWAFFAYLLKVGR